MSDAVDRRRRELEREHQPRSLKLASRLDGVQRIAVADETQMASEARQRDDERLRASVIEAFDEIEHRLDFVDQALPRLTAGTGLRDRRKAARRVIRAYRAALP